jgi:hypothetical protein
MRDFKSLQLTDSADILSKELAERIKKNQHFGLKGMLWTRQYFSRINQAGF